MATITPIVTTEEVLTAEIIIQEEITTSIEPPATIGVTISDDDGSITEIITPIVTVGEVISPTITIGEETSFTVQIPESFVVTVSDLVQQIPSDWNAPPGAINEILNKPFIEGVLPAGFETGDFVRYNKTTGSWETKSEPAVMKGLVLTPALASLIDAEGAIYYNSTNKSVMVCTSI